MQLCKHDKYKIVDWIKDPKWMTKEILINSGAVSPNIEHYVIRFTNDKPIHQFSDVSAKDKYGWFYMSGKTIRSHKTQKNGNGTVYVVPMSEREDFHPIQECEHIIK